MDLFEYEDYKSYTLDLIEAQPKRGYGMVGRIAEEIRVHSVVVSQVLRGSRHFTIEQALDLSKFLGHSLLEEDFFILLVQRQRAGSHRLISRLDQKIQKLREDSKNIESRIGSQKNLDAADKAQFYSEWYYSGTRILSSIPGNDDVKKLAAQLNLPQETIQEVVQFLLEKGLCELHEGRLQIGPQSTHLNSTSPLVQRHHKNWRLKAIQAMDRTTADDLYFTSPMSMSLEVGKQVRKELIRSIEKAAKLVDPSPCEITRCLNVDWFGF